MTLALAVMLVTSSAASGEQQCPERTSETYYFRPATFNKDDAFVRAWYSKHLLAMNEPSMQCGELKRPEYRFTWLRTFHHPIAVRVTATDHGAHIESIELDGRGGYEPGKELRRDSRDIPPTRWRAFQSAIDKRAFTAPSKKRGFDGAEWIFESRTSDGYRAVSVWTPTSGPARELGDLFLAIAGIEVPKEEKY